jgi:hypothetical protein
LQQIAAAAFSVPLVSTENRYGAYKDFSKTEEICRRGKNYKRETVEEQGRNVLY